MSISGALCWRPAIGDCRLTFPATALVVALMLAMNDVSRAATLTWDTSAASGFQVSSSLSGGTWDFNSTASWSTNGTTLMKWTSNSDIANFQLSSSSFAYKQTITNLNGQVGAAGLVYSGAFGGTWQVSGSSLQLGSIGIINALTTDGLSLSAPLELTDSQTWATTRMANNNVGAGFIVNAAISGTGNLTIDGRGLSNPTATGNTVPRTGISFGGVNSLAGTTRVTGGAALWLDYTTAAGNSSRLDDSSALILDGGSIYFNAGAVVSINEIVGSTEVNSGANTIIPGVNGGGGTNNQLRLGALIHNTSGTLDFSVASGTPSITTTTQNNNGILGGWATRGGNAWAVGSSDGSLTAITGTSGSQRASPSVWGGATENVNAIGGGTLTASKTINSLKLSGSTAFTVDLSTSTLTLASGGIIGAITGTGGATINNGTITSGQGDGELYVHTPNPLTVGSVIADNGATPTILVKAGVNTLTLNGANTYTGGTYINSGTLQIGASGSIGGSVTIQGGATLDVSANGFTVGSGKTLAGHGIVTGNVTVASAGTLDPGGLADTGKLSLGGNLTMASNSTFEVTLHDPFAGGFDQLDLTGSVNVADSMLDVSVLPGFNAARGTQFTVLNNDGTDPIAGLFRDAQGSVLSSGSELNLGNGVGVQLNYFGGTGNDLVFTVVPEPSAWVLAVLGGLVLTCSRRLQPAQVVYPRETNHHS